MSTNEARLSVNRTASWVRTLGLVLGAFMALVVLAGCTAPAGKVETNTAASAARRVGITDATTKSLSCTVDSDTTTGTTRVVKATCDNPKTVCCVIPVTATYKGSTASATASFDAQWLPEPWARDSGRTTVTCAWTKSGSEWAMTSCAAPVEHAA